MESLLTSGCGLSLKSAQDDCNGTCVKFRAWKPTGMEIWYYKGSIGLK